MQSGTVKLGSDSESRVANPNQLMNSLRDDESSRTIWNGVMEVRVYETAQNAAEGRTLVFETELGSRRAKMFPTNWRELSDAALLSISDRTPD